MFFTFTSPNCVARRFTSPNGRALAAVFSPFISFLGGSLLKVVYRRSKFSSWSTRRSSLICVLCLFICTSLFSLIDWVLRISGIHTNTCGSPQNRATRLLRPHPGSTYPRWPETDFSALTSMQVGSFFFFNNHIHAQFYKILEESLRYFLKIEESLYKCYICETLGVHV